MSTPLSNDPSYDDTLVIHNEFTNLSLNDVLEQVTDYHPLLEQLLSDLNEIIVLNGKLNNDTTRMTESLSKFSTIVEHFEHTVNDSTPTFDTITFDQQHLNSICMNGG